MSILDELVARTIEGFSYDSDDEVIHIYTDDDRIWMFSIDEDGSLRIEVSDKELQ